MVKKKTRLSPTVTYIHLLGRTGTYLHILTLLAGGGGGGETVEPDAPPLGNGRIKIQA